MQFGQPDQRGQIGDVVSMEVEPAKMCERRERRQILNAVFSELEVCERCERCERRQVGDAGKMKTEHFERWKRRKTGEIDVRIVRKVDGAQVR